MPTIDLSTSADQLAAQVANLNQEHVQQDEKQENLGSADAELQRPLDSSELPAYSKVRLCAIVATLTGTSFTVTIAAQGVVIILPQIGRDLNIPDPRQQWIVSAYALTFGCFLLLWGRLADVYGKRLIFLFGFTWFTATMLIGPFLSSEIAFNIFRGLQGLGAAANVPTALGIIGATFSRGKAKNYAVSFYSAGFPMGSVIGNLVAGVVGQYASWKWLFWILAMISAAITVAGYFLVPDDSAPLSEETLKTSVDWIGGTLITVGLLLLLFTLTDGNVVGWSSPYIPVLLVVAILIVVLFVLWQWYLENRTTRRPLMKVSIWQTPRFAAAQIIMALFFAAFNNFLIFSTFFYQDYLGLDLIQTTLRFIPTGVVGCFVVLASSQILSRIPGMLILIFGALSVAISCLLMAVPINPSTIYWAYGFPAMSLSVFGADTVYPCLALFTMQALPKEDQAMGGGIVNAVGAVGRAVGLAVATAIETAVRRAGKDGDGGESLLSGLRAAQWTSFAFAVTSVAFATWAFKGAGKVGGAHK